MMHYGNTALATRVAMTLKGAGEVEQLADLRANTRGSVRSAVEIEATTSWSVCLKFAWKAVIRGGLQQLALDYPLWTDCPTWCSAAARDQ